MKVSELKDVLVDLIAIYYPNTEIRWGKQKRAVKPSGDFIQLNLAPINFSNHSNEELQNNAQIGYIESKTRLEVQLFTHGAKKTITDSDGTFTIVENTALDDMMELTKFLTSKYADDYYREHDISVQAEGAAQDISEVLDEDYEYRAFQEYTVFFNQTQEGYAGISNSNWKPTASGGGTKELADKQTESLEPSEIQIIRNN